MTDAQAGKTDDVQELTDARIRNVLGAHSDTAAGDVSEVFNEEEIPEKDLPKYLPQLFMTATILVRTRPQDHADQVEELSRHMVAEQPAMQSFSDDEVVNILESRMGSFFARLDQLTDDHCTTPAHRKCLKTWARTRNPLLKSFANEVLRHIKAIERQNTKPEVEEAPKVLRALMGFREFYGYSGWPLTQLLHRAMLSQAPMITPGHREHYIWTPELWLYMLHAEVNGWKDPVVFALWLVGELRNLESDRILEQPKGHCQLLSSGAREALRSTIISLSSLLPINSKQFEIGTREKLIFDSSLDAAHYLLGGLHRKTYRNLWSTEVNKAPYPAITKLIPTTRELPNPGSSVHPFWVQEELRKRYELKRSAK